MIQDLQKTKNRREFIRDGLRIALVSGLVFKGLWLEWRGYSSSGKESSCLVDLPCRDCSKLPDCQEPKAIDARQKPHSSDFSLKR